MGHVVGQHPQTITEALLSLTDNKLVLLLIINLLLLVVGCFMDMTAAVLIFTPILLPVVVKFGMSPLHFGLMLIFNLCIGLCTPPVGSCLFVGCGVAGTTIAKVWRPLLPFFFAMFVVLLAVTFWPALSLALPKALGFEKEGGSKTAPQVARLTSKTPAPTRGRSNRGRYRSRCF